MNYLARGTRPDIAFVASHLASSCSYYQESHWKACLTLLPYPAGTVNTKNTYHRDGNKTFEGYADADWASDEGDRKSVSGFCFKLASGPMTWSSKKQDSGALSSRNAEYYALGAFGREAVWLPQLMLETTGEHCGPGPIHEDNQPAIALAKSPVNHTESKHIDVLHHGICKLVANDTITLQYLPTNDMNTDLLTKPLPGKRVRYLL